MCIGAVAILKCLVSLAPVSCRMNGVCTEKVPVNIYPWGCSGQNSFRCSSPHHCVLCFCWDAWLVLRASAPDSHSIVIMTLERQKSVDYNLVRDLLLSFLQMKELRPRASWLVQGHLAGEHGAGVTTQVLSQS